MQHHASHMRDTVSGDELHFSIGEFIPTVNQHRTGDDASTALTIAVTIQLRMTNSRSIAMKSLTWFALAGTLACACGTSQATVIDFENVAAVGGGVNVNPAEPYSEDGFTLTPTNNASAVVDAGFSFTMPGNTTDFFAFEENNIITLTGPAPFDLTSVLIGQYTFAGSAPSLTIAGTLFGGGSINATFQNLTTATLAVLNWSNLLNVQFRSTDDAAIDNLVLNENSVPEPASLALFGLALAGAGYSRRRARG